MKLFLDKVCLKNIDSSRGKTAIIWFYTVDVKGNWIYLVEKIQDHYNIRLSRKHFNHIIIKTFVLL